jgi:hypothetical protein
MPDERVRPIVPCPTCGRCGRAWAFGGRYRFPTPSGEPLRLCLLCAFRYRPVLRRALGTALVVGTILTAINQGDAILTLTLTPVLLWKIPLTYLVPFSVSMYAALRRLGAQQRLRGARPAIAERGAGTKRRRRGGKRGF